jgi:hypothetical protein
MFEEAIKRGESPINCEFVSGRGNDSSARQAQLAFVSLDPLSNGFPGASQARGVWA